MTPFQRLTKEMKKEFTSKSGLTGLQFNTAYNRYLGVDVVQEEHYGFAKAYLATRIARAKRLPIGSDVSADVESLMHLFEFVHKSVWKDRRCEAIRAERDGLLTFPEIRDRFYDFAYFKGVNGIWQAHPVVRVFSNGSRSYATSYSGIPQGAYFDPAKVSEAISKAIDAAIEYNKNQISHFEAMKTRLANFGE